MVARATTADAYRLMHDGAVTMAAIEANGFRVDTKYLDATIAKIGQRIKNQEDELRDDPFFRLWRREYGQKANLGSRAQLAHMLFEVAGHTPISFTAGSGGDEEDGRPQADEAALEHVNDPFAKKYLAVEKLKKLEGTYLQGIRREVDDYGLLHTFFNLHTTTTYRSSSDSPNLQNVPIRVPEIGKLIRQCFIPTDPDHVLIEMDYNALEVRVAACYHKDPTMLKYLETGHDMHRDMAVECFKLPTIEKFKSNEDKAALKAIRQQVKALFVFAEFYGDYYIQVCQSLWEAVERHGLVALGGKSLYDHLADVGINTCGACDPKTRPARGTFEKHIKEVEDRFWNERFPVYTRWKKNWFQKYLERGYFDTLTGFHIAGVMKRNEVINYPVQGSAFHCLLRSIIHLHRRIQKERMDAKIVCQIHDSGVASVHKDQVDDFVEMAQRIMVEELCTAWSWIIVPMIAEVDVSPVGGSWHDKKPYKKAA